ncbi:hypothetical protein Tco_1425334 [Tanacetum coccineum]
MFKDKILDKRMFKDKIPPSISETLMYQSLARHPANVQYFSDPILFFAGLKTSWEYSPQHPAIFLGGKELAFRNFMFAKDDEEMSFLPYERSFGFGGSSPSASINNEPLLIEVEPLDNANPDQLVENTANSGGSLVHEEMTVIGSGNVAERMKNRRYGMKGSAKPPTKSWQLPVLFPGSSAKSPLRLRLSCPPTLRSPMMKLTIISYSFACISFFIFLYLQSVDCHLMISNVTPPAWRGHTDYQSEVELLDLHDRCYVKQAVVDNARDKARYKECEDLKAKCEASMVNFDKNPSVNVLRQKIKSLLAEVKEHKSKSKVAALEVEKSRLEAVDAQLRKEVKVVKCDRADVVSKVVPYVAMDLVHSDEMDMLVGKIKQHTKSGNDLNVDVFQFLSEVTTDPSVSVKSILSKKPKSLRRPTPTNTTTPAPSDPSQQATPSSALTPNPVSPPLEV